METAIDANAPLDHIEFHIFPMQNRYEACVSYLHKKEKVSSGLLEHLLQHSAKIRELHSKGSNAKFGLSPPEYSHDIKWFTKSTLIRFLHIIGSANILEVTSSLKNEISQLKEARIFHLLLYAKGSKSSQSEELDGGYTDGARTTTKADEADVSKNKLLHAIDSRLAALRGELTIAFDQAAGSRYSVEEMTDIEKFSRHFGSLDLSDSLHKHIELRQAQAAENSGGNQFSDMQVRHGASPATVEEVERQSSTGSDESSSLSEEEIRRERSRTVIRSASPRRSASPMRRVQIGRSGCRRSTAITIKSLTHFPARDRSFLPAGAAASDSEEGSQQEPKKSDNNVRISVQDAINLFEGKQRDQKVDVRKSGSFVNASVGANKSVLRRWSSGMGDDSSLPLQDTSNENPITKIKNDTESREIKHDSQESEARSDIVSEDCCAVPCGLDAKLNSPEIEACTPVVTQEETLPTDPTGASEKLISSLEWNRQKEVELNELLMKMKETKPVKSRTVIPANKRHSLPSEQRGGFYDHYKEKRDEKLRVEAAGKKAEKDKQIKPLQQSLNTRKSQVASANVIDAGRKYNVKPLQKPQKSAAEPANCRTESPKPGSVKKATPRSSSVPHTRKPWSSVPSPRGPSPVKTPATSAGVTPTRRRPRSTTPVSRTNVKAETCQTGAKPVKSNLESKKSLGNASENKQQFVTKPWRSGKSKVQIAPENHAPAAKPSLYSKVTKKSSIVPLESKPFLRKGSGTISNANPAEKKNPSASLQEALQKSLDLTPHADNVEVSNPSEPEMLHELEIGDATMVMENGLTMSIPVAENNIESVVEPQVKPEDEEETISPAAWVEIEEHKNQLAASEGNICEMEGSLSPADKVSVGEPSPRVHHSLSQMLLEDISEPDFLVWGNAGNPTQVVEYKDSPKGLKRLLKFTRKSKTDANAGGLSSFSAFTEGEDDAEDSKSVNKRSAENLLKKATLRSKNNGSAQPNLSKFNSLSLSQQFQDGLYPASSTTSKGSRSFFSLSAFKGSK